MSDELQLEVVAMRGLPGSGKSYAARSLQNFVGSDRIVVVSRDDIRAALFNGWTGKNVDETLVSEVQKTMIVEALKQRRCVIVDDCNLKRSYLTRLAHIAHEYDAEFRVIDMTDVPLDVCLAQNKQRDAKKQVPTETILNMYSRFVQNKKIDLSFPREVETDAEPYVQKNTNEMCILVDIDGTVADCTDVRDPYDTSRYHLDKPKLGVIEVIRKMIYDPSYGGPCINVVFCSGRHEDYRGVTEQWLIEHVLPLIGWHERDNSSHVHWKLLMRQRHSVRDDIEKLQIFNDHIRHNYNVLAVFDDRNRVVQMWRRLGLTVLQVADGDF